MSAPDKEQAEGRPAQRSDRVWALFDEASDLPPAEQQALLEAACAGDFGLRAAVERLLTDDARLAAAEKGAFLKSPVIRTPAESPVGASPSPRSDDPSLPRRIGRYRLTRLLGEGGMGSVYEAEQDDPRRTVAIKVVRPGLAQPALLERFRHESQILGRLHHSGIAQVYEAGLANDGQPFFAMELIRGLPLGEYARFRSLTLPARLELLARVCDAVQHAHEQGVIHRDLKPANILVEESGQPKVLDFGVARATDADLLTGAGLTRTGQLLGTPNYMSPEQVSADPAAIDHRADVYALGVILFELAAQRLPFQLENQPLAEAARLILEEDAPRLGSLNPELRGDLETIAAKALAKDAARRYATAADLAADLRRFLAHEPILARPPSALYHLRQFSRRHKSLVGGVVATGAALVLGLAGTILFAVAEARQRGQAELNASAAEKSAREADRSRLSALRETYQARLAATMMALREGNVREAATQLEAAPAGLRGWEWQHLHARVSDLSPILLSARPEFDELVTYLAPGKTLIAKKGDRLLLVDIQRRVVLRELCDTSSFRGIVRSLPSLMVAYKTSKVGTTLLDASGTETNIPLAWESEHVTMSRDRKLLAMWNPLNPNDRRLRLFELPSGRLRLTLDGPKRLHMVALSPDGEYLAGGSNEPGVLVWNAATGKKTVLQGHTSEVYSVAFHPDGKRLVSGSIDKTIRQWDLGTGQMIDVRRGHPGQVMNVAYSPDGEWIASSDDDRTVRISNTDNNESPTVLPDHDSAVFESFFSADGLTLSTVCHSQPQWRIWPTPAAANLVVLRGHSSFVYAVVHSPDGRLLASAGWDDDHGIRLWDAVSGALVAVLRGHTAVIFSLAFSPDSRRLVSRSDDATVRLWDTETGAALAVMPCDHVWHRGQPQSVVVTPDGRSILTGTTDGLRRWDLATGKEQRRVTLPLVGVRALAVRPKDGLVAASCSGPNILLVDLKARQVIRTLPTSTTDVPGVSIHSLAFSPDGRQLLAAGNGIGIQLWDVDSGKLIKELHGHSREVFAAIFHPDGQRVVSAGRDRTIRVWDLVHGDELAQLLGHTNYIFSLSFSPDGRTLASGSGDFSIRLWESERVGRRLDARREAAALRPEAERLVEQLWREKNDPAAVVEALRADRVLSDELRHAALRAVLGKVRPPEADPGNPHGPG